MQPPEYLVYGLPSSIQDFVSHPMSPSSTNQPRSLVQEAQIRVGLALRPGDWACDATVGNGHDTCFLARCVGAEGRVWGFDCQAEAIAATRLRLETKGAHPQVTLAQANHAEMLRWLPPEAPGRFGAVMFNLGYLPGGDKAVVTTRKNTVLALAQAWELLRPQGLLSVLCYRGHPGGVEEWEAVRAWAEGLPPATTREWVRANSPMPHTPQLGIFQHD